MPIKKSISDFTKNKLKPFGDDTSRAIINVPSKLFDNASTSSKFGNLYLFQSFGQAGNCGLQLNSQITTHYTEENYAINDHWAVEPTKYTLSGLIGEVIYRDSTNWSNQAIGRIKNYLAPLGVISPSFDSYTQSAINLTNQVEETYRRYEQTAKQALRSAGISQGVTTSNQEYVVTQLETLVKNRVLVSIYTPYGTYTDMAITGVNVNQENSLYSSRLEVQLQQWHNVETKTRDATADEKAELARIQSALSSEGGIASTSEVETSSNSTLRRFYDTGIQPLFGFFTGK